MSVSTLITEYYNRISQAQSVLIKEERIKEYNQEKITLVFIREQANRSSISIKLYLAQAEATSNIRFRQTKNYNQDYII